MAAPQQQEGLCTSCETVPPQREEEGCFLRSVVPVMSAGKFPRRMDTYSGVDDFTYDPSATSRKVCFVPKLSPAEASVFGTPFEAWLVADRDKLRKCSVDRPVTLRDCKQVCAIGPVAFYLFVGDITKLAVDAIVNAANDACLGGGGVDKAVHMAAGPLLRRECATFPGCSSGHVRITKGYNLPAKFVLHAVGPKGRNQPKTLASCYTNALKLARMHCLRTIAFCSISTGSYGYPQDEAAEIAVFSILSDVAATSEQQQEGPTFSPEGAESGGGDGMAICFVCFKPAAANSYMAAFKKLMGGSKAKKP